VGAHLGIIPSGNAKDVPVPIVVFRAQLNRYDMVPDLRDERAALACQLVQHVHPEAALVGPLNGSTPTLQRYVQSVSVYLAKKPGLEN